MKKILFCIATGLAMFSCQSDSPGLDPDIDGNKELREVNFSVSTFTQETEPLLSVRTAGEVQETAISYFVYNTETGAYVKQKNFIQKYEENPTLALKDTLPAGKYTVCIAIQYVQDRKPIAQPNIAKKYTDAVFVYTPASPCFFKTQEIDITAQGTTQPIVTTRITGAAEIFINDIMKISATNVTIGAHNIPQAFKISTLEAVTTNPATTKFEATFPMYLYNSGRGHYYENIYSKDSRPFPAVYSGGFLEGSMKAIGGPAPETYYRYIHSIPTTGMYFQIQAGTNSKKVEGFEIKKNTLTKLSGELAAMRENSINVSVDLNWQAAQEIVY